MRLVTYDDGRVGKLLDGRVLELDVPDDAALLRARRRRARATGREFALSDVRLRAPIIPKKFFHTGR